MPCSPRPGTSQRACDNRHVTAANHDPAELERVILHLLSQRAPGKSICPSDAARAARPDSWRPLMDDVRAAAGRLVVDIGAARGPVRIRIHPAG